MSIPSKRELFRYYRTNTTHEECRHFAQRIRVARVRDAIRTYAPPNPLVLDIGCGDGLSSRLVLSGLRGALFIGIEYSFTKITQCQKDIERPAHGVLGDAEALPIADTTVDLALFM